MNLWSVIIRDNADMIQDATYQIQGLELRALKMSLPDQVSYENRGSDLYTVVFPVSVGRDVHAGSLARWRIIPPVGFSITGNKTSAVLPIDSAYLETHALVLALD